MDEVDNGNIALPLEVTFPSRPVAHLPIAHKGLARRLVQASGRGFRRQGATTGIGSRGSTVLIDVLGTECDVDRWPGATSTAERIVLYALPPTNPLMPLVDRAMESNMKRATATARPDSERVILSVAAQPGALGLVDLTKIARHETKVKLLAILPPDETEAVAPAVEIREGAAREGDSPNFAAATAERNGTPPVPRNLGQSPGYPLAGPVTLYIPPKASGAARALFAFLNDGGGREALLASGLVPQPLPQAEVAAAYGPADESEATGPSAQVAAAYEEDASATVASDHLHDVLRGALGGSAEGSPTGVTSVAAQPGTNQTVEDAAASTPLGPDRPAPPVAAG